MRHPVLGRVVLGLRPVNGVVTLLICLAGCRCCCLWDRPIGPSGCLDVPIFPEVRKNEPEGFAQEAYSQFCSPDVSHGRFELSLEHHAKNWKFYELVLQDRNAYAERLSLLRSKKLPDTWAAIPWVLPDQPFPPTVAPDGDAAYTVPAVHAVASCYYATYPDGHGVFTTPMPPNCDIFDFPTSEEIRDSDTLEDLPQHPLSSRNC